VYGENVDTFLWKLSYNRSNVKKPFPHARDEVCVGKVPFIVFKSPSLTEMDGLIYLSTEEPDLTLNYPNKWILFHPSNGILQYLAIGRFVDKLKDSSYF